MVTGDDGRQRSVVLVRALEDDIPSMFGTIDCLRVKWAALVRVSSLTVIFLLHSPMAAVFAVVLPLPWPLCCNTCCG